MPVPPSMPLFDDPPQAPAREIVAPDAVLLRGFACADAERLLELVEQVFRDAPARRMWTPGGRRMSVCSSNCGPWGWVSDRHGYRYVARDPQTHRAWPAMPGAFAALAGAAARAAGFGTFEPDACLINGYVPGARMALHQDRDERDVGAPIVSVSLGLPATFLFGGLRRADKTQRVSLLHGDVLVWGGVSRMAFHGVAPLADGQHSLLGRRRVNLTLRKAR